MDGRVLEKTFQVTFQSDPEAEPVPGDLQITLADDGRLEIRDTEGRLWRCHIVKLFAGLEEAEATGVVYIQSQIHINSGLVMGKPGTPNPDVRRVE